MFKPLLFNMFWISLQLMVILISKGSGSPSTRIVGGSDADIVDFPHMCSLRYSGSHSCGCAIISNRKVITSAFCVDGRTAGGMEVHYGSSSRLAGGHFIDVVGYVIHPDYRYDSADPDGAYANNLAVLTLAEDVHGAITMALPSDGDLAGDICTMTGWGSVDGTFHLEDTLKKSEVRVLTQQECRDQTGLDNIFDNTHVCVTSATTATVACHGDNGGPLTCISHNGSILAGIVSFGMDGECNTTYPSIFTRVSNYVNWI